MVLREGRGEVARLVISRGYLAVERPPKPEVGEVEKAARGPCEERMVEMTVGAFTRPAGVLDSQLEGRPTRPHQFRFG